MTSTIAYPITRGADTHAALLVAPQRLGKPMDLQLPDGRTVKLELSEDTPCGTRIRLRGLASGGGDVYLEVHILDYLAADEPAFGA